MEEIEITHPLYLELAEKYGGLLSEYYYNFGLFYKVRGYEGTGEINPYAQGEEPLKKKKILKEAFDKEQPKDINEAIRLVENKMYEYLGSEEKLKGESYSLRDLLTEIKLEDIQNYEITRNLDFYGLKKGE